MGFSNPLTLVPGLTGTVETWRHQISILYRDRDVSVIEANRFGDSISTIAEASPIFALAEISMGGMIALEAIGQRPDRIEQVALMATTARPCTESERATWRAAIQNSCDADRAEVKTQMLPPYIVLHPNHVADNPFLGLNERSLSSFTAAELIAQQKAIITRPDARPTLGHIDCPTLVMRAPTMEFFPEDHAVEIHRSVRDSALTIIEKAGHLLTWEAAADVDNALWAWLMRPLPAHL